MSLVFLNAPRYGLDGFDVPYLENVLADPPLPSWARRLDCRHAAQFENPADCGSRREYRCECGNLLPRAGRYQATQCKECRNRDKCREAYRLRVRPGKFSRMHSPWENN